MIEVDSVVNRLISFQPKQMAAMEAILDRRPDSPSVIGFGGSRGSAKSRFVRNASVALALGEPGMIIWIIRRVWDDLNKDHVKPMFIEHPEFLPFWHAGDKELRFPNGSSIFFIHAGDTGRAKRKARGPQAHYIFLEQAEEFAQAEMEQLAGSNRAPAVKPGFCKRIYTFNPGGIGTNYLRRIFHLKEYRDAEQPSDYIFIQGFGWDNYEWFRSLEIVSEWDFYHSPEWTDQRRFDVFVSQTDFGKKLAALPPSQRIGELMGSFESFAGQYFADVWEESAIVLPVDLVAQIVKPWWRRWIATDWGFSHYAATGWFASGLLSPEEVRGFFKVETASAVRVIILYREVVISDYPEPDLARLIVGSTPDPEKREVRDHWMGPDAWAKRGSANTVAEQMEPILMRGGLQRLSKADTDRVGGWRLMYNAFGSARKLRRWASAGSPFIQSPDEAPAFFVGAQCTETQKSIPYLACEDDNPTDIRKDAGKIEDDVADMVRYGLKSYLTAEPNAPRDIVAAETYARYQDPTARAMAMLRLSADQERGQRIQRRRRA